jgi:hypothetical protein
MHFAMLDRKSCADVEKMRIGQDTALINGETREIARENVRLVTAFLF